MCQTCPSLSRRAFGLSALALALPRRAWSADPETLVEPVLRLQLPPGAPPTVAVTLDACGGGTDMRVLDAVIAHAAPVTVFATALWLRANPAAVSLLRAHPDLFSVQNHGALHLPAVLGERHVYGLPVAGTIDAIRQEVAGGAEAIVAAGFPRPRWYRDATALYSPAAIACIEGAGLRIAGFSLNADEGASLPAASVAHLMAAARSGDVVIGHMNQPHRPSGAGIAAGIASLHAAGMRFVTLDALPVAPLLLAPHGTPRRRAPVIS